MGAAHTVPAVDDTDLGGILADLANVHPGLDKVLDGLREIAEAHLTIDLTQTLAASLAGNADCDLITAVAQLVARITNADSSPALRTLPLDAQKTAQQMGEQVVFDLSDPNLHQIASETAAFIDGHRSKGPAPMAAALTINDLVNQYAKDIAFAAGMELATTPIDFIRQLTTASINLDDAGINNTVNLDNAAKNLTEALDSTGRDEVQLALSRAARYLKATAALVGEYRPLI